MLFRYGATIIEVKRQKLKRKFAKIFEVRELFALKDCQVYVVSAIFEYGTEVSVARS